MERGSRWVRVFADAIAIALVFFIAYRVFVAPRNLAESNAYPAPAVSYQMLAGKPFVLKQHRGRVVFLEFYASWCAPCKEALPLVERFARSHPEVKVVPIDVGEPRSVAAAFARTYALSNVALDPRALSRGFFQIEGFTTVPGKTLMAEIDGNWH